MGRNRPRNDDQDLRFGLMYGLSWTAGFVDAVVYIALYHVFVANMTGNTVVSATGLTQDDWGQFFRRGAAIPVFVGGMLFSKCGIYLAERRRISFLPALLYFFEALLLGFFVLLGSWPKPGNLSLARYFLVVALASFAMGIQNAMHTHFGPFNVHTTHVTGTLARFTDELAQFLIWFGERWHPVRRKRLKRIFAVSWRQTKLRNAVILAGVWGCYYFGAGVGAFLKQKWNLLCLLCPIALLLLLTAGDLWRPAALRAYKQHL